MNDISSPSSCFVEGFVIDDETHEVVLCRLNNSPLSLFGGFRTELSDQSQSSFPFVFAPTVVSSVKEEPLFSLVRITHQLVNKFIPPNEWIDLGEYQNPKAEKTLLFATTWPMNKIRVHASIDVVRVPLDQWEQTPNISPHVRQALSLFS